MVQINFDLGGKAFDPAQSTYVVTHGFLDNSGAQWVQQMRQNLELQDPNANIISINWPSGTSVLDYFDVVNNTVAVGNAIAQYLRDKGADPTKTQLIGHSLGAHISGIAGDVYDRLTGNAIDTIVGLDPAGPSYEFSGKPLSERLDASDATRVIALHTSSTYGYDPALADLDLYLNWNRLLQPGESDFQGNHSYAYKLYNQLLGGSSFVQDTSNAAGNHFDLNDINNDALTGSVNVNTYLV